MSQDKSAQPEKAFQVLFVCTGNTCRSPMAESLFSQMLSQELHCDSTRLKDHGLVVKSAGVKAVDQQKASPGAMFAMAQVGLNLAHHSSRLLTQELLDEADLVLTMTSGHLQAIEQWFGPWPGKVQLLSRQAEIFDPFGMDHQAYVRCRNEIASFLNPWKESLLSPTRGKVI